jgi:hypothetical protein
MDCVLNLMDVAALKNLTAPTLDNLRVGEGMAQSAIYTTHTSPECIEYAIANNGRRMVIGCHKIPAQEIEILAAIRVLPQFQAGHPEVLNNTLATWVFLQ